MALMAAGEKARLLGYSPLILSSLIEGETRDVALFHTAVLKELLRSRHPVTPPACIISGGETTVTLERGGRGGRNQEFALAAALDIAGEAQMARGRYMAARERYEEQLTLHPAGRFSERALERLFQIAEAFLAGRKQWVLGFVPFPARDEGVEILQYIAERAPGSLRRTASASESRVSAWA